MEDIPAWKSWLRSLMEVGGTPSLVHLKESSVPHLAGFICAPSASQSWSPSQYKQIHLTGRGGSYAVGLKLVVVLPHTVTACKLDFQYYGAWYS